MKKPKLVVILGAGASHDCTYDPIDRKHLPPLTKDIFSRPYINKIIGSSDLYPGAITFGSSFDIASRKGEDINLELELTKRYKEAIEKGSDKHILRQIFDTIYYLQSLFTYCSKNTIRNISFYNNLIEELVRYFEVSFLTFNYDTLLEKAFKQVLSHPINNLDDYINNKDGHKIIKLHGSCDWSYRITTHNTETPSNWFDRTSRIIIIDELIEVIKKGNIQKDELGEEYYTNHYSDYEIAIPTMVIPLNHYDNFLGKQFLCPNDHLEEAKKALSEANNILSIGWSGNEDHFGQGLLHESKAKNIKIVTKSEKGDHRILNSFEKYMPHIGLLPQPEESINGFESFLSDTGNGLDIFIRACKL